MTDEKRKISRLCLTGFLLTILSPVLYVLTNNLPYWPFGDAGAWALLAVILLLPVAGLILSIAGVATARKRGRTGKGFGIAGIVLSSIYVVIVLIIALIVGSFIAFFGRRETDKKIPTFYSDSDIVAVRYYYRYAGENRVEELDEDRLDEFVDDLDSMELEVGGMMDYYWGGTFGIEMELEDGTYMTYDGTRLEQLQRSRLDEDFSSDDKIYGNSDYVRVMNEDFWEVMEEYFPSIEENGDHVHSN